MENSSKLFFGSGAGSRGGAGNGPKGGGQNAVEWYVAIGEKWIGPLAASDIHHRIEIGQLTWAHFAWKKGQAEWTRLCELDAFKAAVPHQPTKEVLKEVKASSEPARATVPKVKAAAGRRAAATPPPAPVAVSDARSWFLYYNSSQFGPFSHEEVVTFLQVGKITAQAHAWSEGMTNWEKLEKVAEFKNAISQTKTLSKSVAKKELAIELDRVEQRGAPRKPLLARLLMAPSTPKGNESVIVGVCRDISVGGMQVLTDQIPGKPGARLKLNISPPRDPVSKASNGKMGVDAFVAEGVIVRILEDGRGFSFRFERLADNARRAIERYIGSGD